MFEYLTNHHRATLHTVFNHGGGAYNAEWREVNSPLGVVNTPMLVAIRKALHSAGHRPDTSAFEER